MVFLQSLVHVKYKPRTSKWTGRLVIKDHTVVEGSKTMIGNDDGSQITLVLITERYIYEIPLNSKHLFFLLLSHLSFTFLL